MDGVGMCCDFRCSDCGVYDGKEVIYEGKYLGYTKIGSKVLDLEVWRLVRKARSYLAVASIAIVDFHFFANISKIRYIKSHQLYSKYR